MQISSKTQGVYYILATLALVLLAMIYAKFILIPLAYAAMLSMLMLPVINWVKRFVPNHSVAYFATFLTLALLTFLPIYLIINEVTSLFKEFSDDKIRLQEISDSAVKFLDANNLYYPSFYDKFTSDIWSTFEWISSSAAGMLLDSGTFIVYLALAVVFSFFLTSYHGEFKSILFSELARKQKAKWQEIITMAPGIVRSYLGGMFIVMAILAILNGVVFFIIGLDYALIWALIIGLLAIIPYVGTLIGLLLPLSYSLLTSPNLTQPAIIAVSFLIIQQIEGNVLTPKIVGDKIDVNPMIIILLMLIFGKIWGVSGVLICLPLAGIVRVISLQWDSSEYIAKIMESKN